MFPRINPQRGNQKSQPAREPDTRGARTADSLLTLVNPAVAQEFSGQQWQEMRRIVNLAMGKPSPKIVDLNFTVDLIISRFYFRLLVGEDTRHKNRRQQSTGSRIGNLIAAVGLIIALNVVVSVSVVVIGYLVKSAIGVDLMPGHWRDWVMNRI